MKILILENDRVFLDRHSGYLEKVFAALQAEGCQDPERGLQLLQRPEYVMAVVDPFFPEIDPLLFLGRLVKLRKPFLVYTKKPESRFIVEAMRLGACDVIDSETVDSSLLRDVMVRAYLEGERWAHMVEIRNRSLPTPFPQIDFNIQNRVFQNHNGERHANREGKPGFQEGDLVQTVFTGISIRGRGLDPGFVSHFTEILQKAGALVWPSRSEEILCGFVEEDPRIVVDRMLGLEIEMADTLLESSPASRITTCLSSSEMVYREDRSTIYAPALNLISHAIREEKIPGGLFIDREALATLSPFQRGLFRYEYPVDGTTLYGSPASLSSLSE